MMKRGGRIALQLAPEENAQNAAEMRLMIEGAIALYEAEGMLLFRRALTEEQRAQAAALNTLENALYTLKDRICELQDAYMKGRLTE